MLNNSLKIHSEAILSDYNISIPDDQIQCDIIKDPHEFIYNDNNKQNFVLPSSNFNLSSDYNNINDNTTMTFYDQHSPLTQTPSSPVFTPKNVTFVSKHFFYILY